MEFPYIKDGILYDTNGRVIEKPSILIIENRVVAYGTYGYLKFKREREGRKLLARGKALREINLVPLYKYLGLEKCLYVIRICILGMEGFYTSEEKYNKLISVLCKDRYNRNMEYWVDSVGLAL